MELIPIKEHLEENQEFIINPDCQESLAMTIDFYKRIGFNPPWISYYAKLNGQLVGAGAFKGKPQNNKVEIAYGTFPPFQNQGIGKMMAAALVKLALETDPTVIVTARTLPEENYSARLLRKSSFKLLGTIIDDEDGEVWEWEYQKPVSST
jgi:RimJ/RimL family protein N-acetyltransferase